MNAKTAIAAAALLLAGWAAVGLGLAAPAAPALEPAAETALQGADSQSVEQLKALPEEMERAWLASQQLDITEAGGWPEPHTVIGRITIPDAGIDCDVIWGDNNADLNKGACLYADRYDRIPGGGLQMLMAAHNNTYFHTLGQVQPGSRVTLEMYYGSYEYEVTESFVGRSSDSTVYDLQAGEEKLILYTCYPFDQLTSTPYRFFVYCQPVSGRPLRTE